MTSVTHISDDKEKDLKLDTPSEGTGVCPLQGTDRAPVNKIDNDAKIHQTEIARVEEENQNFRIKKVGNRYLLKHNDIVVKIPQLEGASGVSICEDCILIDNEPIYYVKIVNGKVNISNIGDAEYEINRSDKNSTNNSGNKETGPCVERQQPENEKESHMNKVRGTTPYMQNVLNPPQKNKKDLLNLNDTVADDNTGGSSGDDVKKINTKTVVEDIICKLEKMSLKDVPREQQQSLEEAVSKKDKPPLQAPRSKNKEIKLEKEHDSKSLPPQPPRARRNSQNQPAEMKIQGGPVSNCFNCSRLLDKMATVANKNILTSAPPQPRGHLEQKSTTDTKDASYNKISSVSNNATPVSFFGKLFQDEKDAKNIVVSVLLPPRGNSEQKNPKDTNDVGSIQTKTGLGKQFSWSTSAKALYVFETKEKTTVKVYSSDILYVPVDCIVNAVNVDLKYGGGIGRAIADAAGKDLNKDGRDYLKQHGKLRVGEVCHTGAGKMSYNYVIHAVAPCWSDYKPYSMRDVESCETDLYNAVISCLSEAEKLKMETIAVSSISSGMYGCPLDLCSIQYAKAVIDYSRCAKSPLKEIHFVDTNMEMIQAMHKTFQSMIPNERIPKSYNKMRYVKSAATSIKDRKLSPRIQDQIPGKNNADDFHRFGIGKSGLVIFPYYHRDYPPGHSKKEFACCIRPGQSLFIYTVDILNMTHKDMIACANTPTGKTKGYLANAIQQRCGNLYKSEMVKVFDSRHNEGDVVLCKSDIPNFKWVAHTILHQKIHCSEDDKEFKVTSSLRNIFLAMKSKCCHSIALPLVGTGKDKADPVYYGERFFEALCEFSSCYKEYEFKVHLVHIDEKRTEKAIGTISKAIRDTRPLQVSTNRKKTNTDYTRWENGARPKSAGPNVCEERRHITNSDKHKQNERHSSYVTPTQNTNQSENENLQDIRRKAKERVEELNYGSSTTGKFKECQSEYDRDLDRVVEKPKADKDDIMEIESDDSSMKNDEEGINGPNERACSETISRFADKSLAVNSILSKETKGNLKIFEV